MCSPLGYLMRPIGGIIFGHIGDKYGRKKALMISVLLIAIPTKLIGFLTTYENIGWYSAALFTWLIKVIGEIFGCLLIT